MSYCELFQVSEIFHKSNFLESDKMAFSRFALGLFEHYIPIRVHVRAGGRFAGSDETRRDGQGSTNHDSRSTNQCISMISSSKKYKGKDDCERNQRLIEKWLYHVRSMYLWFERNIRVVLLRVGDTEK